MKPESLLSRALGSLRVLTVVSFVLATLAVVVVAGTLYGVIQGQARQQVERSLDAQAGALARDVVHAGRADARQLVATVSRYFTGETRVEVIYDGVAQIWEVPAGPTYAEGDATYKWAYVRLQRLDPISAVDRRLLAGVIALGIGSVGLLAWLLSDSLTRRLRRSLRHLAGVAGRLSEGDLSVRADPIAGEAGIVADAFNRMAARLDANDARQREFLADAAHELRTPVTAIEGFATALADGTARDPDDRQEAAETIRDEAVRLRGLVQELQELTWLDLDPPVERIEADLADVARQTVARYAAAAAERGVTLTGPVDAAHVTAWTDPAHVATIVANLTSNAIAATPPGGRVRITAEAHGRDATLTVADTGVGIAAENLPYIFERLFRVDGSRARTGLGGSGLGLAIVKRLVLLLNGKVEVSSTPRVGTIFTVTLRGVRSLRPGRASTAARA